MKKILFVASEPKSQGATECDEEHNFMQDLYQGSRFQNSFNISYCNHATVDRLIGRIKKLSPEYLHYCGHGNLDGEPMLLNNEGEYIPFKANVLKDILKRNERFECIVLCSCHSAELVEELKAFSENTIGFVGKVRNNDMHRFTQVFYGELFQMGSPFHAFLNTVDTIKANIQQGNHLIFRTKLNDFMEQSLNKRLSVAQAQKQALEENINVTDHLLQELENEISSTSQSYSVDFLNVIKTHPTPDELIWFSKAKDQIAIEISSLQFRRESKKDIDKFADELQILFLGVETALLYYQDHELIRANILSAIEDSGYPTTYYIESLEELKIFKLGFPITENFKVLFEKIIDISIETLSSIG